MADVRITRIELATPTVRHESITHIGNETGVWPKEQVVVWIEQGLHSFYVEDSDGRRARVGVVHDRGRLPHLRALVDGEWSDTLLALARRSERSASGTDGDTSSYRPPT